MLLGLTLREIGFRIRPTHQTKRCETFERRIHSQVDISLSYVFDSKNVAEFKRHADRCG